MKNRPACLDNFFPMKGAPPIIGIAPEHLPFSLILKSPKCSSLFINYKLLNRWKKEEN